MKKNNALLLISSVVAGTVLYLYKKAKDDAFVWSKEKIQQTRTDEIKKQMAELDDLRVKAQIVRDKEHNDLLRMKGSVMELYSEVKEKTIAVEANERNIIVAQDLQYEKDIRSLTSKTDSITAKENSLIDDICKSDETIKALKTAKKALKKAEKDTSEVERKISDRKKKLAKDVLNARSSEEKDIFKQLAVKKKEYADRDHRYEELRNARTESEKELFKKKSELFRDLSDDTQRKEIIAMNRMAEDQEILDQYGEHLAMRRDVLNGEAKQIENDFDEWFGRYLSEELRLNKPTVFCLGMLPLVPVCILVGRYVKYILKLCKYVKKGE